MKSKAASITISLAIAFSAPINASAFVSDLQDFFLNDDVKIHGTTEDSYVQSLLAILDFQRGAFKQLPVPQSDLREIEFQVKEQFDVFTDGSHLNFYDPEGKKLSITNQVCGPFQVSPRSVILGMGLHEFSHSIFQPNLELKFRDEIKRSQNAYNLLHTWRIHHIHNSPQMHTTAVALMTLAEPFHELFADATTVLVMDDPKAMANILQICNRTDVMRTRDFSVVYPLSNWQAPDILFQNPHAIFNPVRNFIWDYYRKTKTSKPDAKAKILFAINQASLELIEELRTKKLSIAEWSQISQESLNRKFIANFKKAIQNGPWTGN